MKTNIIANNSVINTIMKNVVKYLCAVVLLIGTSAHAWGADPAAPSAHYTLIKSTGSLSVNDRVILYSPNGTAIAGLSTCNSNTDARVSSVQSEWGEYKVTNISGSTIKLQDTRVSGSNSYAYADGNQFKYTSSGSATAFTLASSGLLSNGTKTLGPVSVGSGDCERNSARFNSNANGFYVFKVGSQIKDYYYTVTAATAELTVEADVSDGWYSTSQLATVHIDGSHFTGAVYAELVWPTWGADDEKGYAENSQSASNGFIVAFKGSTYSPGNDEGVYVTIWNTIPYGTYNAQLHFYPKDGSTVTGK